MNFGQALEALKADGKVTRPGWNGKGMFLFLVGADRWTPDVDGMRSLPTVPFIAMKTADELVVPWLASQTDMLAEDWMEVT